MEANKTVERLVAAYRKSDRDFFVANALQDGARESGFASIIGNLQGSITLAAAELGYNGSMREEQSESEDA